MLRGKQIYVFIGLIFFIFTNMVTAEVLYRNNFDDKPDWVSGPEGTGGLSATHNEAISIGFTEISVGGDKITGPGHELFQIDSAGARGTTGKGLSIRVESNTIRRWRGGRLILHFADPDIFDASVNDQGYEELYIRYYVKWDSGWDWGGGQGNYFKIFRAYSDTNYIDIWNSVNYGGLGNHYRPDGSYKEAHVIVDWGAGPPYYLPTWCEEGQGTGAHCNTYNGRDKSLKWTDYFTDAKWHYVEHHIKMNDIGSSNAITEIYIDGSTVAGQNTKSFALRHTPGTKFDTLVLFDNHWIACTSSCPKEQTYYIDDLIISTTYVGPEDGPPLPPGNLTVE